MLLRLMALGAAAYAGYRFLQKRNAASAYSKDEVNDGVRNAGPKSARDENDENWTETDQELDESFPASDPPANY